MSKTRDQSLSLSKLIISFLAQMHLTHIET